MKPSLFVGSSTEQLDLAYNVQEAFQHEAEVTVWSQDVFRPSASTMGSLLKVLARMDFGVFIFAPDDETVLRGEQLGTVRDNVIFELGLFVGRLGAERSFLIVPSKTDLHLPTDLASVITATYNPQRQDGNLLAALGPACNQIKKVIRELGPINLGSGVSELVTETNADLLTDTEDILAVIQSWIGKRSLTENARAIKFSEVDQELSLVPGSAKRHIEQAAEHWSYRVARKGEQTILFEKIRQEHY